MSSALDAIASTANQNAYLCDVGSLHEDNFEGLTLLGGALGVGLAHTTMKIAQGVLNATSHLNQNRKRMLGNAIGSLLTVGAIDYARSQMHFLTSPGAFNSAFQAGAIILPIFTASLDSVRERYQLDNDDVKFMLSMVKGVIPGSMITSWMLLNGHSLVGSVATGAFIAYQISNRSYGAIDHPHNQ